MKFNIIYNKIIIVIVLCVAISAIFRSWNHYVTNSGVIIEDIPCNTMITDVRYSNSSGLTYLVSPMPDKYIPSTKMMKGMFSTYVMREHRCWTGKTAKERLDLNQYWEQVNTINK